MNKFKNYIWMATGFAVLAAVISGIMAGPAIAQAVKAALVKNVDEPGRVPYEVSTQGTCTAILCTFTLPSVPSGRVVIQHISGQVAFRPNPATSVAVRTFTDPPFSYKNFFVSSAVSGNINDFDQSVQFYVDGPQTIQIQLSAAGIDVSNQSSQLIVLTGYVVDCTGGPCSALP